MRESVCHAARGEAMRISPRGSQPSTRWSPATNTSAPAAPAAATRRTLASSAGSLTSGTRAAQAHSVSKRVMAAAWRANLRARTECTSRRTRALVSRVWPAASSASSNSAHRPGKTMADSQTWVSRKTFKTLRAGCRLRSASRLRALAGRGPREAGATSRAEPARAVLRARGRCGCGPWRPRAGRGRRLPRRRGER